MRSKGELEEYAKKLKTRNTTEERLRFSIEAYEGCVPLEFWNIKKENVKHNTEVFKEIILKYCKKINVAHKRGYSLCLLGNNGVGKTYFISYILTRAIKKGKTVYYTTLPELEHNIKRGFDDREISRYLEMLLTSDFLAIDEMGKEQRSKKAKTVATFMDTQVERILKKRFDDSAPVLLGTNLSTDDLVGVYGSSVASILRGKYQLAQLDGGDYRTVLARRMNEEMGF